MLQWLISNATKPSENPDDLGFKRALVASIIEQICGSYCKLDGNKSPSRVPVRITELPLLLNLLTFSEHKLNLLNIKRYLKASGDEWMISNARLILEETENFKTKALEVLLKFSKLLDLEPKETQEDEMQSESDDDAESNMHDSDEDVPVFPYAEPEGSQSLFGEIRAKKVASQNLASQKNGGAIAQFEEWVEKENEKNFEKCNTYILYIDYLFTI